MLKRGVKLQLAKVYADKVTYWFTLPWASDGSKTTPIIWTQSEPTPHTSAFQCNTVSSCVLKTTFSCVRHNRSVMVLQYIGQSNNNQCIL